MISASTNWTSCCETPQKALSQPECDQCIHWRHCWYILDRIQELSNQLISLWLSSLILHLRCYGRLLSYLAWDVSIALHLCTWICCTQSEIKAPWYSSWWKVLEWCEDDQRRDKVQLKWWFSWKACNIVHISPFGGGKDLSEHKSSNDLGDKFTDDDMEEVTFLF